MNDQNLAFDQLPCALRTVFRPCKIFSQNDSQKVPQRAENQDFFSDFQKRILWEAHFSPMKFLISEHKRNADALFLSRGACAVHIEASRAVLRLHRRPTISCKSTRNCCCQNASFNVIEGIRRLSAFFYVPKHTSPLEGAAV